MLTLCLVAPVLAVVVVAKLVVPILAIVFDPTDGSDDRPPIIVSNGSLIFDGGDAADSATIKSHWADWVQDDLSSHWKPDLPTGKNVNRYDVTVQTTGNSCAPMSR